MPAHRVPDAQAPYEVARTPLSDMLKARRTACKKAMDGMKDTLYSDSASLLREMELTAPAMEALLEVTLDFDREYTRISAAGGWSIIPTLSTSPRSFSRTLTAARPRRRRAHLPPLYRDHGR